MFGSSHLLTGAIAFCALVLGCVGIAWIDGACLRHRARNQRTAQILPFTRERRAKSAVPIQRLEQIRRRAERKRRG